MNRNNLVFVLFSVGAGSRDRRYSLFRLSGRCCSKDRRSRLKRHRVRQRLRLTQYPYIWNAFLSSMGIWLRLSSAS